MWEHLVGGDVPGNQLIRESNPFVAGAQVDGDWVDRAGFEAPKAHDKTDYKDNEVVKLSNMLRAFEIKVRLSIDIDCDVRQRVDRCSDFVNLLR